MNSALVLLVLGNSSVWNSSLNPPVGVGTGFSGPGISMVGFRHPGYTYTPGIGGHRVHATVTRWKAARRICKEEGGDLAIINSQAEADVIGRLFVESEPHAESYAPGNAWIGNVILPSVLADGWVTVYGDSLERAGFNEWHEDATENGPHCGSVFRDGNLGWFNCIRHLGFVCEVPYVESLPDTMKALNPVLEEIEDLDDSRSDPKNGTQLE